MRHSLTVQYPIKRCGTADGTNQHRTTRTFSSFDHTIQYSSLISESKIDEMLHITNFRTPKIRILYAPSALPGCTGKAINIGED